MRSWLFVPGDSERKILKALASQALASQADVIILDLEDSVTLQNKQTARAIVAGILAERPPTSAKIYVRVNALDSGLTLADLDVTSPSPPDGYMLPKSANGDDVEQFAKLTVPGVPIIAIATETASSLFGLGTYAKLKAPLIAMTWGSEDLSADLGAISARDDHGHLTDPYRLARSLCLIGARAAQVEPIDSIYANFRDADGLKRQCQAALRDGFTGKMAIHPDQIAPINEAFTPTQEAIAQALKIVEAFASSPETGVIALDGQMFDKPHLTRAQNLLLRADPDKNQF